MMNLIDLLKNVIDGNISEKIIKDIISYSDPLSIRHMIGPVNLQNLDKNLPIPTEEGEDLILLFLLKENILSFIKKEDNVTEIGIQKNWNYIDYGTVNKCINLLKKENLIYEHNGKLKIKRTKEQIKKDLISKISNLLDNENLDVEKMEERINFLMQNSLKDIPF